MSARASKKIFRFFHRQIRQIHRGGLPTLLRKARVFLVMPLAAPGVLLVRVLRPPVVIRFGPLRSERIGHFAGNTELYLCERDADMHGRWTFDIFLPYLADLQSPAKEDVGQDATRLLFYRLTGLAQPPLARR